MEAITLNTQDATIIELGSAKENDLQFAKKLTNKSVKVSTVNNVLDSLMSIDLEESVLPKYRYPSGGSLYPVQTYLWVRSNVEGLKEGTYYYHPRDHKLFLLYGSETDDIAALNVLSEPTKTESSVSDAPFAFFLITQLKAMEPLYPDTAKEMSFLEAGYMTELLLQTAKESGLGMVASFNSHPSLNDSYEKLFQQENVRKLFKLDDGHLFLTSLYFGHEN